jgi:ABC-type bacteriocin/lantibiotic exporter with double-glycine peptidase domain
VPDAALMPPDPAYLVASIEISQVIDKQFQQPVLFLICVSSDCVISIYFICAAYNSDLLSDLVLSSSQFPHFHPSAVLVGSFLFFEIYTHTHTENNAEMTKTLDLPIQKTQAQKHMASKSRFSRTNQVAD